MTSRYFTLAKCDRANVPFNIIIGGRGTGKTFTTLDRAYSQNGEESHFLYMRRTEVEISSVADVKYNPFKALNRLKGYNVSAKYVSKYSVGEFTDAASDPPRFLGYGCALSTFGKIRGADLSDVDKIIFDEFIKAKSGHPLQDEADLFFNAYETISRNREVEGRPPVVAYLLSNATSLKSPILEELGLIPIIEKMMSSSATAYTDYKKGVHIELPKIGVSEEKQNTALYRLAENTTYSLHALDNEFAYDSFENVISGVPLNEYAPWVQYDDIYIYRHKARLEFFCTAKSRCRCQHVYVGDKKQLFKRSFGGRFHMLMLGGYVYFDSFSTKSKLTALFE